MPRIGLVLLLLLTFNSVQAKKFNSTKEAMNEIFGSFVNLLPYASNEMRFNDPKAEEYIKGNLANLLSAFQNAGHLKKISTPGFRPSYQSLQEHLQQTYDNFTADNKSFARTRLKATAQMCMSCHTQLPYGKQSSSFKNFNQVNRRDFNNDYEYGDYLFLVRDYTSAIRYYEKEIEQRIEKNAELQKIHKSEQSSYIDFTIEKSLRRMVSVFTKVFYRPEKAYDLISRYSDKKDLPDFLKEDVLGWMKELSQWKTDSFRGKLSNDSEVRAFIKKHLEVLPEEVELGSTDITLLISSGALYRYININPKSQTVPQILYWLSRIDHHLEHSYFYSLSEVYLKNCIKNYPQSEFAPKCLAQYRENLEFGFTGTSGTNIPEEEMKIYNNLAKYLKSRRK